MPNETMTSAKSARRGFLPLALGAMLWIAGAGPALAQVQINPADVVGPSKCADCHEGAIAVWRHTHHYATYTQMPRNPKATVIARKMGLKRIKEGSLCLDCHFTTQMKDGKREAIAGISCESCHGAGKGYVDVHSNYSGKKKNTESKAEAAARWEKSEKAGMIRPKMMYRWAKNCYSCHIVPQEKLVNVGGHPAGSPFELVSWSQGEIRHNVWYTQGKSNPPADLKTRRKMFIVGMAVELEESLRAVGEATQRATYAVTMAKRADLARRRFAEATKLIGSIPEMEEIAKIGAAAQLKLNNKKALSEKADKIGELTQKIVEKYDGSTMGGIDKALPGEDKWKGKPQL
ncbi:MAG: multiheme c-type cytochrome [Arenicellales bacterium]